MLVELRMYFGHGRRCEHPSLAWLGRDLCSDSFVGVIVSDLFSVLSKVKLHTAKQG